MLPLLLAALFHLLALLAPSAYAQTGEACTANNVLSACPNTGFGVDCCWNGVSCPGGDCTGFCVKAQKWNMASCTSSGSNGGKCNKVWDGGRCNSYHRDSLCHQGDKQQEWTVESTGVQVSPYSIPCRECDDGDCKHQFYDEIPSGDGRQCGSTSCTDGAAGAVVIIILILCCICSSIAGGVAACCALCQRKPKHLQQPAPGHFSAQPGQPGLHMTSPPPVYPTTATTGPGLPPGWTSAVDSASGKTYYVSPDQKTQWEPPVAPTPAPVAVAAPVPSPAASCGLPPGWTSAVDSASGKTYYVSPDQKTQWEPPPQT